jgi:repressor LexA
MDPTNSRWQVFWALHHAIAANGHSPTVRELAEVVGLATGTVHHHLKALKLDRWIDWPAGKARSITILRVPTAEPTRPPTSLAGPAVMPGNGGLRPARVHVDLSEFAIAAGPPTAVQPIEDALAETGLNLQDGDFFTHRVEGDSMRDAGIREGDALLVRRQANAREGDIVVATIPDEVTGEPRATIKRLPRNGGTRLLPENPAYEPIENDEITIIGKVMEWGSGVLLSDGSLDVLSKLTPASARSRKFRTGAALAPSPTRRTRRRYTAAAHRYCVADRPAALPQGGAGRQRSGRSR